MQPATKHYLFFALLLVTLAALVAFVVWNWRRAQEEAAETGAGHTAPRPSGNQERAFPKPAEGRSSRAPLAPPAATA